MKQQIKMKVGRMIKSKKKMKQHQTKSNIKKMKIPTKTKVLEFKLQALV
jgi:hypothetical protein